MRHTADSLIETKVNRRIYLTYPGLPPHIFACLEKTAGIFPDKTAFVELGGPSVTFAKLLERTLHFASVLYHRYHIRKGDVCALLCVNSIDFVTAFYAMMHIGAIALPLSTKYKEAELAYPLRHSGVKLIVMDEKWLPNVEVLIAQRGTDVIFTSLDSALDDTQNAGWIPAPPCPCTPQDGAAIVYTSGTTGNPKGAYITHFNFLHSIESYRRILRLTSGDSTVIPIPISNITGLAALMGVFVHIGGTVYLQPYFDAKEVVRTVREKDITFLHASPTVFIKMLEQREAFPSLPSVTHGACGSANLPMQVLKELHDWMPYLCMHTVYGLTETTSPATVMPNDPLVMGKPGSSGVPIPGLELRIWDEQNNREAAPGTLGTLHVWGSTVIERYWSDDEQGAFHDGWFDTGDIARLDEEGYLYILDRKKDMINRGGEKVYCIEVENVLSTHPAVAECAVIGIPDDVYGEQVCAVVRLGNQIADDEQLKQYMYGRLATYKLPVKYVFVGELPKSENGKINKRLLKDMLQKEWNIVERGKGIGI